MIVTKKVAADAQNHLEVRDRLLVFAFLHEDDAELIVSQDKGLILLNHVLVDLYRLFLLALEEQGICQT